MLHWKTAPFGCAIALWVALSCTTLQAQDFRGIPFASNAGQIVSSTTMANASHNVKLLLDLLERPRLDTESKGTALFGLSTILMEGKFPALRKNRTLQVTREIWVDEEEEEGIRELALQAYALIGQNDVVKDLGWLARSPGSWDWKNPVLSLAGLGMIETVASTEEIGKILELYSFDYFWAEGRVVPNPIRAVAFAILTERGSSKLNKTKVKTPLGIWVREEGSVWGDAAILMWGENGKKAREIVEGYLVRHPDRRKLERMAGEMRSIHRKGVSETFEGIAAQVIFYGAPLGIGYVLEAEAIAMSRLASLSRLAMTGRQYAAEIENFYATDYFAMTRKPNWLRIEKSGPEIPEGGDFFLPAKVPVAPKGTATLTLSKPKVTTPTYVKVSPDPNPLPKPTTGKGSFPLSTTASVEKMPAPERLVKGNTYVQQEGSQGWVLKGDPYEALFIWDEKSGSMILAPKETQDRFYADREIVFDSEDGLSPYLLHLPNGSSFSEVERTLIDASRRLALGKDEVARGIVVTDPDHLLFVQEQGFPLSHVKNVSMPTWCVTNWKSSKLLQAVSATCYPDVAASFAAANLFRYRVSQGVVAIYCLDARHFQPAYPHMKSWADVPPQAIRRQFLYKPGAGFVEVRISREGGGLRIDEIGSHPKTDPEPTD